VLDLARRSAKIDFPFLEHLSQAAGIVPPFLLAGAKASFRLPTRWVTLQKWLGTAAPGSLPDTPPAKPPGRSRPVRLLLVEANPRDAELLEAILRGAGGHSLELTRVERLNQACERLQSGQDEVVLLDLTLPDSSGLATIEQVHAAAPAVPVVALAGGSAESLAGEAILLGAEYCVLKSELNPPLLPRVLRYAVEHAQANEQARVLALQDGLTGLLNLRGFAILAEQQLKLARRYAQTLLLLLFDLEGLEQIHDRYGHAEGSRAMIETAALLRETLRASDILARLGGDEFAALIIGGAAGNANALLERFRTQLAAWNERHERDYRLEVSIGLAPFDPQRPCSLHQLLAQADRQMHQANKMPHQTTSRA
jgi:diguanylate cyclase (GGDEF)-like protein